MRPYKGYIKDDPNFKVLFENTVMLVGHVFEDAYCYNKLTRQEFSIFQFDNDPTCGIVGKNNDWCLIGGDVLVLRSWIDHTLRKIDGLSNVFELKAIDDYAVQVLTDPWGEDCAIWQLEINLNKLSGPTSLTKVRSFNTYIGQPYSEDVDW